MKKANADKSAARGVPENGLVTEYFKNGSIDNVGEYSNGLKTGQWKYFLANGNLKAVGNYVDGKMHGDWTWYRENGQLMQTGSFDDQERKTGVWTRYKADGTLLDAFEYVANKKCGKK